MPDWCFNGAVLGTGLAMDALAVSMAMAMAGGAKFKLPEMIYASSAFGLFQFLMPAAGTFLCGLAGADFQDGGRIAASVLLIIIGGKMLFEKKLDRSVRFGFLPLIAMAFATSIDAFVVGVGFSLSKCQEPILTSAVIGIVTFFISLAGCLTGSAVGRYAGGSCTFFGGIVLIAIALKSLLQH